MVASQQLGTPSVCARYCPLKDAGLLLTQEGFFIGDLIAEIAGRGDKSLESFRSMAPDLTFGLFPTMALSIDQSFR
jgi:hypothetical protein